MNAKVSELKAVTRMVARESIKTTIRRAKPPSELELLGNLFVIAMAVHLLPKIYHNI